MPIDKIFWGYGFWFDAYNPLVLELKFPGFMDIFYKNYQPTCISDAWFPTLANGNIEDYVFEEKNIPWLPWNSAEGHLPSNGLAGTKLTQGVALRGPVVRQKLSREKFRLQWLRRMILSEGYMPHLHGHIKIQILADDNCWAGVCVGGNHRLAVLASLGYVSIPVERSGSIIERKILRNEDEEFVFSAAFSAIGKHHRREFIEKCFAMY